MSFQTVATLSVVESGPLGLEVDHPTEGAIPVALVKSSDGTIHAIHDDCTHAHVKLSEGDFDESNCSIECYLHGSHFDLRTGEALNPPAVAPAPIYPVRVEGNNILVDVENPLKEN